MNRFELTRQAAKAAGYTFEHPWNNERMAKGIEGLVVHNADGLRHTAWDPLNDDGCALALAVKLKIRIGFRPCAYADTPTGMRFFGAHDGGDAGAQTRLAIVRAAAHLAMPPNA